MRWPPSCPWRTTSSTEFCCLARRPARCRMTTQAAIAAEPCALMDRNRHPARSRPDSKVRSISPQGSRSGPVKKCAAALRRERERRGPLYCVRAPSHPGYRCFPNPDFRAGLLSQEESGFLTDVPRERDLAGVSYRCRVHTQSEVRTAQRCLSGRRTDHIRNRGAKRRKGGRRKREGHLGNVALDDGRERLHPRSRPK